MTDNERYQQARLSELSAKSYQKGIWLFSDFLTPAEQGLLPTHFTGLTYGGYPGAERRIAVFGSEDLCGYIQEPPILLLHISSLSKKFADKLTHRDYLGTLLGLGLDRRLLGDILVGEAEAYVFCLETIADYICGELARVKHTAVKCEICSTVPDGLIAEPEERILSVASLRCDSLISAVFHLSRSDAKEFFEKEHVFCDGRLFTSPDRIPEGGNVISVRGKGRFRLNAVTGTTKKGKLTVSVSVW